MKRKLMIAFSIMALLVMSVAVFAYSRTAVATTTSCTCCGDSCPMKKKDGSGKETASCCDDCDCCKDGHCNGDSCPMKSKGANAQATSGQMQNVVYATGDGCSCSCCKKGKAKDKSST